MKVIKTFSEAFIEIKKVLDKKSSLDKDDPNYYLVTDCMSYDYGWYFYYNSKLYVKSRGEHGNSYIGDRPLYFDKFDGEILIFPRGEYDELKNITYYEDDIIKHYFEKKYPKHKLEKENENNKIKKVDYTKYKII